MDKEFNDIQKLFEERDDKAYIESTTNACYEAIESRRKEREVRKNRENS